MKQRYNRTIFVQKFPFVPASDHNVRCKYEKDSDNLAHIYTSHYDQMQAQMGIFERKWCDYIVVSYSENMKQRYNRTIFVQKFPFVPASDHNVRCKYEKDSDNLARWDK